MPAAKHRELIKFHVKIDCEDDHKNVSLFRRHSTLDDAITIVIELILRICLIDRNITEIRN